MGQLGDGHHGDGTNRDYPMAVTNLDPPIALLSGRYFNCVLTTERTVRCWGENTHGQLGFGLFDPALSARPLDVINLP